MAVSAADRRHGADEVDGSWTGRTRGGFWGNWIFLRLLATFGLPAAYALLVPVTFYYLFAAPRAVRASTDYLRRMGGPACGGVARYLRIWKHFFTFGQVLLDRVAIISGAAGRFSCEFDGEEHLRDALAGEKGLLLITAHAGNWEGAGHMLSRLDVPVNVVAFDAELEHIKRLFDKAMESRRFRLIEAGDSLDTGLAVMSALSRGEIVAMHADRGVSRNLVEVDFLGSKVGFPAGPYLAAAASGAPVVTAFAFREAAYRYKFKAWPAEYLQADERSDRDRLAAEGASRFAGRLEQALKEHVYQWFNFFDFWGEQSVER